MDENEIQEHVEAIMKEIRESDAFNPHHASKAESRMFLLNIIEECQSELDALGDEDDEE
jgi:diaminopimelate decarboxylase